MDEHKNYVDESLKNMSSESKLTNIAEVVKIQTDMLDDVIKKMKEMNDKISSFSTGLSSFELRIRFFEVLDGLVRVDNSKDITFYMSELESLISMMKVNNLWDAHRENLAINLLTDIGNNWRKYGYNEISKVFDDEIEKIKSTETNRVMLKY